MIRWPDVDDRKLGIDSSESCLNQSGMNRPGLAPGAFALGDDLDAGARRHALVAVGSTILAADRRVHHIADAFIGNRIAVAHAVGATGIGAAVRIIELTDHACRAGEAGKSAAHAHAAVVPGTIIALELAEAVDADKTVGAVGIGRTSGCSYTHTPLMQTSPSAHSRADVQ